MSDEEEADAALLKAVVAGYIEGVERLLANASMAGLRAALEKAEPGSAIAVLLRKEIKRRAPTFKP